MLDKITEWWESKTGRRVDTAYRTLDFAWWVFGFLGVMWWVRESVWAPLIAVVTATVAVICLRIVLDPDLGKGAWEKIKGKIGGGRAFRGTAATPDTETLPVVRMTVTGNWLNTPFQYEKLDVDPILGQLYGEFLFVKFKSNRRLGAASTRLTLEGSAGLLVQTVLPGVLAGVVPAEFDQTVCVMRRRFRMADVRYADSGVEHNAKHRVDVDAVFLPSMPGETSMPMDSIYQLKIEVFPGDEKRFVANMTLDLRGVPAPVTRLVTWPQGNIDVRIKNNFISPTSNDF